MGHRRFRGSMLAFALAGMLAVLTALPGFAASSTVTVTPGTLAVNATSWYFYDDNTNAATTVEDPAHYKFVVGPGSPPAGVGSVFFRNDIPANANQRWTISTRRFAGTKLANISALKFNTYQPSAAQGAGCSNPSAECAIFLNLDVNFAGTPGPNYQGRLAFSPGPNGVVQQDSWQEWSVATGGALLSWSRFVSNGNKWPDGNTAALRTWSDIVASFPNATMDNPQAPGFGQLVFRAGDPYPTGFTGHLDKVTVGVGADTTVFDFEPTVGPPTDKDQCKNDGWKQFNTPKFKNQGDCVSYTN